MATENEKNRQGLKKIDQISLPTIHTRYANNAESVPIQPFGGRSSSSDSRRTSISSNSPTFSSFKPGSFEDGATSLKSKRSISVDSGIDSLSEAPDLYSSNESLSSTGNQDITEDSGDEKISTNKNQFASIKKSSAQNKFKKVAPPTVPTFKSNTSNVNAQTDGKLAPTVSENSDNILNLEKPMGEKVNSEKEILSDPKENLRIDRASSKFTGLKDLMPLQEKVKEISRKDQLSSKIDKFIPQVNLSTRKTVEERVKYGTLDMLKVSAERLNLKINKVDSLLKSGSLIKVDKNNNDEVLLVTKKDTSLLKELKRDLKRTLYGVNKQLFKETKKILAHEQREQQELQDKILKGDIAKIKEAISTAKSKVDLKERYNSLLNQLGKVQTHFNHNKKLHPDLKEAITELRKERWASQTNIWAIRPDDTTKNYLPESRVKLTFAEKKEIFSCKRDAAKSLLDSQQYKGEDKEILKGLHKLYSNLAKSSEDKPKEKSNLEYAFNNEFRDAYKESYETRLKEFGSAYQKSCSTKLSEVLVSQLASSLSK